MRRITTVLAVTVVTAVVASGLASAALASSSACVDSDQRLTERGLAALIN